MIAKIGRSANLYGALAYNNLKVEKEKVDKFCLLIRSLKCQTERILLLN
ncbi:hypothetical protein M2306_001321 [Myroides gitamensis]|nr:hypothetical protein [Myroides gitamensis]